MLKIDFKNNYGEDGSFRLDLVIPTISKDQATLLQCLISIRENVHHKISNVYIVSPHSDTIIEFCRNNDCIFVDERVVLGYGKESIDYVVSGVDRSGWIFQQLLKLSGEKFVTEDNFLVVDSDTVLLDKHTFFYRGRYIFFENEEWHNPYFETFKKMFGYKTRNRLSFTSHMMIFNTKKLQEMKRELEERHGMSWDKVYLSTINTQEQSCVSDYDTYANWLKCNFPKLVILRPFYNKSIDRNRVISYEKLKDEYGDVLHSVSLHSYTH